MRNAVIREAFCVAVRKEAFWLAFVCLRCVFLCAVRTYFPRPATSTEKNKDTSRENEKREIIAETGLTFGLTNQKAS